MPSTKKQLNCSKLAASLADIAFNLAAEPHLNSLDDVVVEMKKTLPIDREGVVNAINELLDSQGSIRKDVISTLVELKIEARRDKKLRKLIDTLRKHLGDGTLTKPKTRNRKEVSETIQQLIEIRDALKKDIRDSDPAKLKRIGDAIARLEARIEENTIVPKVKPEAIAKSKELIKAEYKLRVLKNKIDAKVRAMEPKSVWGHLAQPMNMSRALMTSMDLSAVFRQGGFILVSHPLRALKSMPALFQSFWSKELQAKIEQEIADRDLAPYYALSKLFLGSTDGAGSLTTREEAIRADWADWIPGVAGSQRAYTTYLNKLRADSFDAMVYSLSRRGEATLEEMKAIANFINVATGRGNVGDWKDAAEFMNTVFFAPRYVVSRFQMIILQPIWGGGGSTRVRTMIAMEYARYIIGMSLIYALARMGGGEIEDDWRSPDVLKIKFHGNTRIDAVSGFAQVVTLIGRLKTGETKSSVTMRVKNIRHGKDKTVPYGSRDAAGVIGYFFRSKLAPIPGAFVTIVSGEDPVGEQKSVAKVIANLYIPMSVNEIIEAIMEHGYTEGAALGMMSILGAATQTYGPESEEFDPKRFDDHP